MPWVTFAKDLDWTIPKAKGRQTIAYKAGMRVLVKQQCAQDAKAAGALAADYFQPEAAATSTRSDKQIDASSQST